MKSFTINYDDALLCNQWQWANDVQSCVWQVADDDDIFCFIKKLSFLYLFCLLLLALLLNQLSWSTIDKILQTIPYRCPVKLIFHHPCALCGMTHAWIAILKGQFRTATELNALSVPFFILSMVIAVLASLNRLPQKKPNAKIQFYFSVGMVVLLVGYMLLRSQ